MTRHHFFGLGFLRSIASMRSFSMTYDIVRSSATAISSIALYIAGSTRLAIDTFLDSSLRGFRGIARSVATFDMKKIPLPLSQP